MSISFGGIGEMCVTFKADTSVEKGSPVKISSNDTVTVCTAGNRMIGVAVEVSDDGYATVQLSGYTTMSYTGTAPDVGFATLTADGNGGVKTATTGGEYIVLNVNTSAETVGFII